LAKEGFDVVVGARRFDRVQALASEIGGRAMPLDVTDDASVEAFCAAIDECSVLVNNAGGALGLEPVEHGDVAKWQAMYDSNVLGVLRMTKRLLPVLERDGGGMVIVIGSIAGFEPYEGGAGYNAAKHAVRALRQVLRYELLGRPVRVCEIDPAMTETEFSLVRFDGDADRAAQVYEGMTPLVAEDVAECVAFVATRPAHVNIDQLVVQAVDQASARRVSRHME
jgi:NADP-dependent 3-hydroxy acid dehydrogenase YdfG